MCDINSFTNQIKEQQDKKEILSSNRAERYYFIVGVDFMVR
jgi:hypothetical protein